MPNYIPSEGIVGWWPFNGNANDESGNGNNGYVTGPTLTTDRFGNTNSAYEFNLNYIKVNQDSIFDLTDSLTINVWYSISKDATTTTKNMFFVAKHIGASTNSSYCLYNENVCKPTVYLTQSDGQIFHLRNETFCATDEWHMLTMTFKNKLLTLYFDGRYIRSILTQKNIKSTDLPIIFGGCNSSADENDIIGRMIGKLDDIGIWNRALSPIEIQGLYNGNICYQLVSVTDTLIISANITGYNPLTYKNTIKIYPNPTKDYITIDYGDITDLKGYKLVIFNSVGQKMFETEISVPNSYIDLNNWTGRGLYFVNIFDSQGTMVDVRKIVIN